MTEVNQAQSYCTNCGRKLESGWRVCPICGMTIEPSEDVVSDVAEGAPEIPGFGRAIVICFRKYVDFSGRASRSEFWFWFLFCWLVQVAQNAVMAPFFIHRIGATPHFSAPHGLVSNPLAFLSLALLLPSLAVAVRRLHDTNRSGAWVVTYLVISVGLAILTIPLLFIAAFMDNPSHGDEMIVTTVITGFFALVATLQVIAIVMLALPGTPGENQYGPAPQNRAANPPREPERNLE